MDNKKETKLRMAGRAKIDWSPLFSEPIVIEDDRPCQYKDYHLTGKCSGPGAYGYGYGHMVLLCEAHYKTAPDPRRIPADGDDDRHDLAF
jgi:hypothetical protein